MTFNDFQALFLMTLREPARATAWLRGLNLPMSVRWLGLVLAVTLAALLAWGASILFPVPVDTAITRMTAQPLWLAVMQFGAILLAAGLMAGVGQMFGGKGSFADALLLTVWIEVMLLVVQVAQVVLMLVFPAIATLLSLVALALFLWLLVQFTKALHGFTSGPKVVMGIIATVFVAGFFLSLLMSVLGLMPEAPV